jgi:flagellar motility protein MotE (MotC chaperone)
VKKIFGVLMLTLAMNFIMLSGGVGYLYQTKRLDKDKVHQIKEILFPPPAPAAPGATATTQPTTLPTLKLEELLAASAGRPAAEQVAMLQRTFDSRMAQLDARERQVRSQNDLVENAKAQLKLEREQFEKDRAALEARQDEAAQLASDKGFQEALKLYGTMKPKQLKDVFATMPDDDVVRYLRKLESRQVSKVLAEFKTPAELQRVKALIEQVRSAEPGAPAKQQ